MSIIHCHQCYIAIYFYASLLLLNCTFPGVYAQDTTNPNEVPIRRVHYGYFPEASPIRVACARGWFKFLQYEVTCYPQTSGTFAVQRLDSGSLHISEVGSTPLAQALARGVDIQVVFIDQYKGDSQGIYVKPDNDETGYKRIQHPLDLVGRRLGVPFGSTVHYQVLFLLDILKITGKVELVNLSPSEIIKSWNDDSIDAAGCWGPTREYILDGDNPGKVLISAGVLGDWGRETFNAVAVRRDFMKDNVPFMRHFTSILGILTDSFLDSLGAVDPNNVIRWTPSTNPNSSYIPSLADTIMKPGEEARRPSIDEINKQRRALDLPIQISSDDQLSCDYLGGGGLVCGRPSLQHIAIQQTGAFLMDQKIINSMGMLANMGGDDGCIAGGFCGSDVLTGSSLDPNLYSLELWDGVEPFFALNETGRASEGELSAGDSDCSSDVMAIEASFREIYFGDVSNSMSLVGRSYSDNLSCWWKISSKSNSDYIVLSFEKVRLWSGDNLYVYTVKEGICSTDSPSKVLLGKITGLDPELPTFQAMECIIVHFSSDGNQERSYSDVENQGDGFYAKTFLANSRDSSFTKHCIGTSHIELFSEIRQYLSSGEEKPYPNDLDCLWEIHTSGGFPKYVAFDVDYDLEPTFDYLELYSGSISSTGVKLHALLSGQSTRQTYYIPTDDAGFATIRMVTDGLGRRDGFSGSVYHSEKLPKKNCPVGMSGLFCEFSHCIATNSIDRHALGLSSSDVHPDYHIGRAVSQVKDMSVPPTSNCTWPISRGVCNLGQKGIRLRFNSPLDLEPHLPSAVGDKILVTSKDKSTEIFVETCTTDEVCSHTWQTGKCENGACTVRTSIDIDITDCRSTDLRLVTDRSDLGRDYKGLDLDVLYLSQCPAEFDQNAHCEDGAGKCVDGVCICGEDGMPCACPCDADRVSSTVNTTLIWAVVVPLVVVFIIVFGVYRQRKIKKSRLQKSIIQLKDEELEAFRNSVVGLRAASTAYMPKPNEVSDATPLVPPPPKEKAQWCWKETQHMMSNHAPDTIAGNPSDCWIKYDSSLNAMIESTYQAYSVSKSKETNLKTSVNQSIKKLTSFRPPTADDDDESKFIVNWGGYKVNIREMVQVKVATGFERDIQRLVATIDPVVDTAPPKVDIDLSKVTIGDSLPDELAGEPQMCLTKGDIIQISSQRQDGWAFGTKLHHYDEAMCRELVKLASKGVADTTIFTDTGWFPLDKTDIPTGDELKLLESQVGGADALQAPAHWDDIVDPTVVQLHELKKGDQEYDTIAAAFMSTLKPPRFSKTVKVVSVQRIQNLAMWQSYVVKRQTICYRETGGQDTPQEMKRALDRFERKPLWHGTNVEVVQKLIQQGFNRSFCGKNATVYGKGVYFARDAEYSAHTIYAVPDKHKVQYMMACRVIVGEYCPGTRDALTPDIRDQATQTLYDTTVGLLSNDTMANPSIYVTYHDAQAYPEYLIKFKSS